MLLAGVALSATARVRAQDPGLVSLSKKEAVREFPALAQPGSALNTRFVQRLHSLQVANDSVLLRDDWPLLVTREVALEVGDEAIPQQPAPTPAPTATPTPWVPQGTALDKNAPASDDPFAAPTQAPSGAADADKKYFIYGTVIRKADDGLLIACSAPHAFGYDSPVGEIWLTGRDSTLGHLVKTVAIKVGRHTFPAAGGFNETVDEYKAAD